MMMRMIIQTLHLLMHDSLPWLAAGILRGDGIRVTAGAAVATKYPAALFVLVPLAVMAFGEKLHPTVAGTPVQLKVILPS